MTDGTTPSQRAGLRHEIAKAIHRYDNEHALSGNDIPSRHHQGEADAVMALLYQEWPWLRAEAEELAEGAATEPTPVYGCTIGGLPAMPIPVAEYNRLVTGLAEAEAERDRLKTTVTRIQALADEYPAGIDTALIEEALDQPGPAPAAAQAADRATQLAAAFRDCLAAFHGMRNSDGLGDVERWQARVTPREYETWQASLGAAGQATAGAWTPPPPGDRREELPPAVLDLLADRSYLSTACDTAHQLEQAPPPKPTSSGAIPNVGWYVQMLHARCRLNQKFTGQLCVCGCH